MALSRGIIGILVATLCVCVSTCPLQARTPLRILSIGNSFSTDAMGYLPPLIREIAPDVDLTLAIAYRGSFTLKNHWERCAQGGEVYADLYKFTPQTDAWFDAVPQWSCGLWYAIKSEPWDIVVLQEGSANSRDYTLSQPYLDHLISWLDSLAVKPFELAWLMTPAYPDGSPYGASSSREMMSDIFTATQHVLADTRASILLPCGTAIENARTTFLDSIGTFGHLSSDALHLQEGIAQLTESYAAAVALLEHLNIPYNLREDVLPLTESWVASICRPDRHGVPKGIDIPGARLLAMKCAMNAVRNPFAVTDMSVADNHFPELTDSCYIDDCDLIAGKEHFVPIKLFNNVPLLRIEADLAVPSRVQPVRVGKHYFIESTPRTAGDNRSVSIRWSAKNLFHLSMNASDDLPIYADAGPVATIALTGNAHYPGRVIMELKNIVATDVQGNTFEMPARRINVNVWPVGDINHDTLVDVSDLNDLLSRVIQNNSRVENFSDFDISDDGIIDISDVNRLINILLQ